MSNLLKTDVQISHMSVSGEEFMRKYLYLGESHAGLVVSTQLRQSKGSGFKSRFGQIAYFHGVKTRLSTLGAGDVPRGSDAT